MKTVKKQIEVVDYFKVDLYVSGFESRQDYPYEPTRHSMTLMDVRGNTYTFPSNADMLEKIIGQKNPKVSFEVRFND